MSYRIGETLPWDLCFFSSFIMRIAYWRTESVCVIRRCVGNRKKIREIKFGNYRHCQFWPHPLLAKDASLHQYIGAAQIYLSLMIQQISFTLYGDNNSPRLPIRQDITNWFCFTGAETEIHKIKDDSKIKRDKNIRDILWTFGTFLLSRYRLPLNDLTRFFPKYSRK